MNRFLQMHILTAYPPSNPNRDDLGRPKTSIVGGVQRLRISSQALKRAIRTSEAFRSALQGHLGERTQRMGEIVRRHLTDQGASPEDALGIARQVTGVFGKLKPEKDKHPAYTEQLAFISQEERDAACELAEQILAGSATPAGKDLADRILCRDADGAVDIAMFGRMLADNPDFNRDAAVQVAHAFTTNKVDVEDDYYTAVDDLKTPAEDAGAGFVGEAGFGAGVYYLYVCVDQALLLKNLAGNRALAATALSAFVRAAATASPSGKKNSFANHVRADYVLLERGDGAPLSLASAFTRPVGSGDQIEESVAALTNKRAAFAASYGKDWSNDITLHVGRTDSVTLDELARFAAAEMEDSAS